MVWILAGEILNISFVSEKAPNMLTKYKITVTVTPNNILFFNQRFDQFVDCSGLTIAPI
jgi:hypothetical protein